MRAALLRLRAAARRVASGGPISRRRRGLRVSAITRVVVVVAGCRLGSPTRAGWRRLDEPAVAEIRAAAFTEADGPATVPNLHDDAPPSPALRRRIQGHDLVAQAERPMQGARTVSYTHLTLPTMIRV